MTTKQEQAKEGKDAFLVLMILMALTPFLGILRALTFRLLWRWFLAAQYGDGPSLQAWFGICVLVSLSHSALTTAMAKKEEVSIGGALKEVITGLFVLGMTIVVSAVACFIWGWR